MFYSEIFEVLRTPVLKNIYLRTTVFENNSRGAIELNRKVFAL